MLVLLAVVALVVVLTTYRSPDQRRAPAVRTSATPAASAASAALAASAASAALLFLHDWDARRADAYATGSSEALRDLYVVGSAAGAADLRLLERYRSRGVRVTDLRMQVLDLAVTERLPDRWTLRVTDRLAGAVAVHATQRTPLPRDTSSTHLVTLLRGGDGRWRVSAVASPTTPMPTAGLTPGPPPGGR